MEIARLECLRAQIQPTRSKLGNIEKSLEVEIHQLQMHGDDEEIGIEQLEGQVQAVTDELQQYLDEELQLHEDLLDMQKEATTMELSTKKLHGENLDIIRRDLKFDNDGPREKKITQEDCDTLRDLIIGCQQERQRLEQACHMRSEGVEPPQTVDDLNVWLRDIRDSEMRMVCFKMDSQSTSAMVIERLLKSCKDRSNEVCRLEEALAPLTHRPDIESPLAVLGPQHEGSSSTSLVSTTIEALLEAADEMNVVQNKLPPELLSESEEDEDNEWVMRETFEGPGNSEEVAPYLCWDGKITNRKVDKGSLEGHIKNFWKEKKAFDKKALLEKKPLLTVADFFFIWLQRKFGKEQKDIADWAHNLLDAALRFRADADCEMWLKVILGEYHEAMYWDEFDMIESVKEGFQKQDIIANKRITGKIRKDVLLKVLRKVFPLKTDVRYNRLKRTLAKEDCAQGATVNYVAIFNEDKDGNQGPFAEAIRDQHLEEREEYLEDIETELTKCAKLMNCDDGTEELQITAAQCVEVLKEVDPAKSEKKRDEYVKRGFGLEKKEKGKKAPAFSFDQVLSIEDFMKHLEMNVVKSSTKRDDLSSFSDLQDNSNT